jgi:hypothetical protein
MHSDFNTENTPEMSIFICWELNRRFGQTLVAINILQKSWNIRLAAATQKLRLPEKNGKRLLMNTGK